jgi:hypothetical protein
MSSSPSRIVALLLGLVLLAVGALGFTADSESWLFGALSVNLAQNVLHLVIGVVLIALSFTTLAVLGDAIIGTVLLVIGIAGLFIISTPSNVIAVNGAANLLHFASAAVLLAVGLGAKR